MSTLLIMKSLASCDTSFRIVERLSSLAACIQAIVLAWSLARNGETPVNLQNHNDTLFDDVITAHMMQVIIPTLL